MSASLPAARGPVGEGAVGGEKGGGSGAMANSGLEEVAGKSAEEELEELEALDVAPTATVYASSAAAAVPPSSHVCVCGVRCGCRCRRVGRFWVGVGGGCEGEGLVCVCVCWCGCGLGCGCECCVLWWCDVSCFQAGARAEQDASTFMPWSLLAYEIQVLEGKIAGASDDKKLGMEDEKFELENLQEMLELQINSGTLSQDEYMQKTKQALEREMARAKEFQRKNQIPQYKEADGRCKAMQKELQG
jgi:hypothetical protein